MEGRRMGKHGTGKPLPPKQHDPPPKLAAAHRRAAAGDTMAPPPASPPKAASSSSTLRDAARELLSVLSRMPWCRDHQSGCPSSTAGPCTCGAEQLAAAQTRLGEQLAR
jgi:hypothetical protein